MDIPLREILIVIPSSYGIWWILSVIIVEREVKTKYLFIENIFVVFGVGFIIHYIFGVRSKLGSKIGITKPPNGIGFAPYSNY